MQRQLLHHIANVTLDGVHRDIEPENILVDKQGVTGRKVQYHSIPYRAVTHFGVETAGMFDLDAELTIWLSGGQGIVKQFGRGVDVYEVQALLAAFVAR